jgi:glycosyltransferase involved in cell wall biosynthesis
VPRWLSPSIRGSAGGAHAIIEHVVHLTPWADPSVFHVVAGMERAAIASRLRERLKLPGESRIVLFAGRLEAQKDPLLLVRAFAELASQFTVCFWCLSVRSVGRGGGQCIRPPPRTVLRFAPSSRW